MVKNGIIAILMGAMLFPMSAFGSRRKQQAPETPDRLNAPTPDGSPTLKATSDWLAKALDGYGGLNQNFGPTVIQNFRIENDCSLRYTVRDTRWSDKHYFHDMDVSFPLGAVTQVHFAMTNGQIYLIDIRTASVHLQTGIRTGGNAIDVETGNVEAIQAIDRYPGQKPFPRSWSSVSIDLGRSPDPVSGAEVPQPLDEITPRIARALQHAVSLCQNTYQSPAQSDNLFRPPSSPTASLAVNPNVIQAGQSTTLVWQTQNADQITIEGLGTVSASGSRTLAPGESTTYKLIAKGAGGAQEANARVTVNASPAIDYEQQLRDAMKLWKNNQVAEASNAVLALIKSDPNRWEGYGLAGAIEKAQNKLPDARASYERALTLAPDSVKPRITQAIQQIETEQR